LPTEKGDIPVRDVPPSAVLLKYRLSTETKLLDDASVSLDVDFLEVVKDTTPLTYELKKRTTGHVVLLVVLKVLGKVSDTVGK